MIERFDATARNTAKAHVTDPQAQEYIKRLEAVANAAWEVYQNVPHASKPGELGRLALHELFHALETVDFLVEEEDEE